MGSGEVKPSQMAEALQHCFRHHHQSEVYRSRLKKRTQGRGETLTQLVQDVEVLLRRSCPAVPEELIKVLAREFFVDVLQDQQLQIFVKQEHPGDLQVALTRAMKFEALLKTAVQPRRDL